MSDQPSNADYIDFMIDHIVMAAMIASRRNGRPLTELERQAFEEAKTNAKGAFELMLLPFTPDNHPIYRKLNKSE